jgi:arabinogalactan oligomer/maltooligosaccharide transport system substrate-binding protein
MQRSIPAVAAALGLSLVLAACGGDSTPENTTSEPTAAETTETTDAPAASGSITIWVDETRINDFDAVVKKFETERGVDVEVVQKASGPTSFSRFRLAKAQTSSSAHTTGSVSSSRTV